MVFGFFCVNLRNLFLCVMRKKTLRVFFLISTILTIDAISVNAQDLTHVLYINEFMQSQVYAPVDLLMEIPDGWVELYNPGSTSVNIKDFRIGESKKFKKGFVLPDCTIKPKSYLVIYPDNENVVSVNGKTEIHTDFRLDVPTDGSLYLFDATGAMVDSIHYDPMPSYGVAFGRKTDGNEEWGMELEPTQGSANNGKFALGILAPPGGSELNVLSKIPCPAENQPDGDISNCYKLFFTTNARANSLADKNKLEIRYTLDGSEPTEESPLYDSKNPVWIRKNTIIKSKTFCEGWVPSQTRVDQVLYHGRDINIPVVSLYCDDAYLNDRQIGIFANNDSRATSSEFRHNWRRPVHITLWKSASSVSTISQLAEMRCAGAWSRSFAQKPLAIYAKDRFGSEDYFYTPIWKRNPSTYNKTLMLRNSGNDFGYSNIRDGVIQCSFGPYCDMDWQDFQPVIFYLNGQYRGMMNARPQANENYVWAHYSGLEDIDLLENYVVKEGTAMNFLDFEAFYSEPGHTYDEYSQWLDVEEYLNVMVMACFYSLQDFPGNNYVLWRPQAEGGRWRLIVKDTDFGFNLYGGRPTDHDYFTWVLRGPGYFDEDANGANSEYATRLFRNMMQDDEIRDMFIDRFTVFMGDFLTDRNIIQTIRDITEPIKSEAVFHQAVYHNGYNQSEWNNMESYATQRYKFMWQTKDSRTGSLRKYFNLGNPVEAEINNITSAADYDITINDISLSTHKFQGHFYAGRSYVIRGTSADGSKLVSRWKIETTRSGKTTTVYSDDQNYILTLPIGTEISKIVVTPNAMITNGAHRVADDNLGEPEQVVYISTDGVESDTPFAGVNMVKYIYKDNISRVEKRIFK